MLPKPANFILQITKGILRNRTMRRRLLSWIVMAVLAWVAVGVFLLDDFLMAYPFLFLVYWGACFCLTITLALLAIYDMLAVRAEIKKETFDDHDPHP